METVKKTEFEKFILDQLSCGGVKYAHSNTREVTDILVEVYGIEWLLGTVAKYVYRFKNLGRERDLLKIATYMFILWIKFGFHQKESERLEKGFVDTTIESKNKFFTQFTRDLEEYEARFEHISTDDDWPKRLNYFLSSLKKGRNVASIFSVYLVVRELWVRDFLNLNKAGQDTDTQVEKRTTEK